MSDRRPSLADKFDLAETRQLLSGTQAIVRLVLTQKARDRADGLETAGYVTGYRGSPIATLEAAFERAGAAIPTNDIVFHPAINEDLAATAIWGSQQAELRGEGKFDGVFAVWYGKGPGVDRSGDALRHANHAGTSRHGGVVALMGDDHTCESSTSAHQSEFAFVDAMIPILNPSGVQEILDYGLIGFALSRYAGVWVGLKCVKDNMESTAVVDARTDRLIVKLPDPSEFAIPEGGLNIRLHDAPLVKEARLHDYKRPAVLAFARANYLDRVILNGGAHPRIGIVTTGKSYLDTRQALAMLELDEQRAAALGLALYKVAMVWPLEPKGLARFAAGLETIIVVEEKRSLIETQVKEQLFEIPTRPRVLGKRDEDGHWLFPAKAALDPLDIAIAIGRRLAATSEDATLQARVGELERMRSAPPPAEIFHRIPYFCAGCPHNTSTQVPKGARAYAGIGCHYMAQWMDRSTEGFTQMGGEGANWVGEAPFSERDHVFQNIGDGTFIHSGSLAIRAAIAAGTHITFKLLYNDAVAMTGGQRLEGGMTVAQMAGQLLAEGAKRVAVVTDDPAGYRARAPLPSRVELHHRRDLDAVQRSLAAINGTTILIYDQTCAAEKRRRRKRGTLLDPPMRAFIDPEVCEGCGDCGVKSNCVAILPLETPLGRKRTIDQSACNKDFSCVEGFCPSFVTLTGATVRKVAGDRQRLPALAELLPEPSRPSLERPYAMLATGIGGTGVVTVSAVLAEAAYLAGLGFGAIDVTGLAQKGGAVACHMRVAARQEDIHAIRVGTTGADLVLGGDLVVTASAKVLDTLAPGHTALVYSPHEVTTGDFTRDPALTVPRTPLQDVIRQRAGTGPVGELDAQDLSLALFGDTLYANMMLLGAAYQLGHVPIAAAAIEQAIAVNGAAVETNRDAFRAGRLAIHAPDKLTSLARHAAGAEVGPTLAERIAMHAGALEAYQDAALASRYRTRLASLTEAEHTRTPGCTGLTQAVADAFRKVLMIKDEYEVARLLTDGRLAALISERFDGVEAITYHMAPPLLARRDKSTGHPRKFRLAGCWAEPVLRLLARARGIRGSWADIFGYSSERRRQRQRIADYELLLDEIADRLSPETHATAVALAALPLEVKGYGHVEAANHARVKVKEAQLLAELRAMAPARVAAE